MARLAINLASSGVSDNYGTFLPLSRAFSGNVFSGLNVTANSSPNMTVLVQPGEGMIKEGSYPGTIHYHVAVDTAAGESVTIATANTTNPRIDCIVGYIDKAVTPTTTNNTTVYKFLAVAGTPAATPAAPTVAQIQAAIGAANPYDMCVKYRDPNTDGQWTRLKRLLRNAGRPLRLRSRNGLTLVCVSGHPNEWT